MGMKLLSLSIYFGALHESDPNFLTSFFFFNLLDPSFLNAYTRILHRKFCGVTES